MYVRTHYSGIALNHERRLSMKASYAILRFAKYKVPAVSRIEGHNERTKAKYASNPDIDVSRSDMNFHLVSPVGRYSQEIDRQLKESGCRVRKDSVRMVEVLVTATPEFFKGKSRKEIREFFRTASDFIKERQDPKTILSAVVHMDEATPHMHLCFIPLTKDGRLSAKEIIGNRKALIKWQDDFWTHMATRYPDLERGEGAADTGRTHIPPRMFKEQSRLAGQKKEIEELLSGVNPLNAVGRISKLKELLNRFLPGVDRFGRKLKKYDAGFARLTKENEKLKAENTSLVRQLHDAEHGSVLKQIEEVKLRQDYEALKAVIDRIPPEIISKYLHSNQERGDRNDRSLRI